MKNDASRISKIQVTPIYRRPKKRRIPTPEQELARKIVDAAKAQYRQEKKS